jgi:hypothetical protein
MKFLIEFMLEFMTWFFGLFTLIMSSLGLYRFAMMIIKEGFGYHALLLVLAAFSATAIHNVIQFQKRQSTLK